MTVDTFQGDFKALPRDSKVYIAGHRGLVGSAIWRHLESAGFAELVGVGHLDLDLRDRDATLRFIAEVRPDVVIDAAARVGGIVANSSYPAEFLSDNLRMQVNLLDSAQAADVQHFLFLGSSCIYPKFAAQPIHEDSLMTGPLEPTNDAYAMAKIVGITHVQAIRRQYGLHYISAMPTNLYGPNDNFHPRNSHVLPALISRFHEAMEARAPSVTCWGTGTPRREFMHVDDMAAACLFLLENYDDGQAINVGTGTDISIAEIADLIAENVGYQGDICWDTSKPDGVSRKLLDVGRVTALGWKAVISLPEGLMSTYEWFLQHQDEVRQ